MLKRRADFDERRLGFPTFGDFLRFAAFKNIIMMERSPTGADYAIRLATTAPGNGNAGAEQAVPQIVSAPREPTTPFIPLRRRPMVRPDLWHAFTDPDPGLVRVFDKSAKLAYAFAREPSSWDRPTSSSAREEWLKDPSRFISITPASQREQLDWRAAFAHTIRAEVPQP